MDDYYDDVRTPPHSIDAEQWVLGGLMVDKSAYDKVKSVISSDDFYLEEHKIIYQAIESLAVDEKPFDFLVLSTWLQDNDLLSKLSSPVYLGTLAKDISSSANIAHHAEIVKDKAILRGLISAGIQAQEEAYKNDGLSAKDKLAEYQDAVVALNQNFKELKSKMSKPKEILRGVFDVWEQQQNSTADVLLGVSTGVEELDTMTQGLQGSQVIVIGARPAMGKTAFQLMLEESALDAGTPVASFSMEMSEQQTMQRFISRRSGVQLPKVLNARLMSENDFVMVAKAAKEIKDMPYYVDDTGGHSPQTLRDSFIAMNSQSIKDNAGKGIGLVVIDYLQLMTENKTSKANNTNEKVSDYMRAMKQLSKDFDIPVVVLSQLNRKVEERPNKRPTMADLRDSGSIEQDASLILFLYRHVVYDEDANPEDAEIIIGKQRSGGVGTIHAGFDGTRTKWFDKASQFIN